MLRSLNEIEMLVRKAGVGAGLHFGLAEDAGQGAAALCRAGCDGVVVFAEALLALQDGDAGSDAKKNISALRQGPSVLDELIAGGQGSEVVLDAVDFPLVLIGLAKAAAEGATLALEIEIDGNSTSLPCVDLAEQALSPEQGSRVVLRHKGDAGADHGAGKPSIREPIRDTAWKNMEVLAARTYVPASAASRLHGAGAGLLDND